MGKILLTLFVLLLFFGSCSKDSGNGGAGGGNGGGGAALDCSTVTNKSFSADISPIIQATCNNSGCHAAGSFNGPGALTNYNEFFNARVQIRPAIASGKMPQNTTLSTAQKNSILCWIDSGAPNN